MTYGPEKFADGHVRIMATERGIVVQHLPATRCTACGRTQEDCADAGDCEQSTIMQGVCEVFGTRRSTTPDDWQCPHHHCERNAFRQLVCMICHEVTEDS